MMSDDTGAEDFDGEDGLSAEDARKAGFNLLLTHERIVAGVGRPGGENTCLGLSQRLVDVRRY